MIYYSCYLNSAVVYFSLLLKCIFLFTFTPVKEVNHYFDFYQSIFSTSICTFTLVRNVNTFAKYGQMRRQML